MTTVHTSKKTPQHSATPETPTAAAATTTSVVSFPTPPEIAAIPAPPAGFVGGSRMRFRGVIPFEAEAAALPAAIKDLQKLPSPTLFVGAPPIEYLIQLLVLAGEWTATRNASEAWDTFAATQEGNVWAAARPLLDEFRTSLAQVLKVQPQIASQVQGLTTFLGIRSAIAQRSAATRRANKKDTAQGERPTHGKVGKKLQRAAEKAALAAADATSTTSTTSTQATAADPAASASASPSPRTSPST